MATLSQIRAGIKTRLDTISGLENHDNIPGTVNPPATVVTPAPGAFVDYGTTMGDQTNDYSFVITLFVQRGEEDASQDALDVYIDPTGASSISAAVEADRTLAGLVHDCAVTQARAYGTFEYNGISYLGCEFPVQVMA